jgi:hypothetical protein
VKLLIWSKVNSKENISFDGECKNMQKKVHSNIYHARNRAKFLETSIIIMANHSDAGNKTTSSILYHNHNKS